MAPTEQPLITMVVGCSRTMACLRQQILEGEGDERVAIIGWSEGEESEESQEAEWDECPIVAPNGSIFVDVKGSDLEDLVEAVDAVAARAAEEGAEFDMILIDVTASDEMMASSCFAHSATVLSDQVLGLVDACEASFCMEFACADHLLVSSCGRLAEEELLEALMFQLHAHGGKRVPATLTADMPGVSDLMQACHSSSLIGASSKNELPRDAAALARLLAAGGDVGCAARMGARAACAGRPRLLSGCRVAPLHPSACS